MRTSQDGATINQGAVLISPPRAEALVNMYLSMIPMGRLARAEEIASAALFLASDESSYMTGADLMDDGGVGQV